LPAVFVSDVFSNEILLFSTGPRSMTAAADAGEHKSATVTAATLHKESAFIRVFPNASEPPSTL
jgi:hypothetical protein